MESDLLRQGKEEAEIASCLILRNLYVFLFKQKKKKKKIPEGSFIEALPTAALIKIP